jgi:hypothetical protein
MYTTIAVLITGIYFIIKSQTFVSTTATLVVGIAVVILAAIDLLAPRIVHRAPPA